MNFILFCLRYHYLVTAFDLVSFYYNIKFSSSYYSVLFMYERLIQTKYIRSNKDNKSDYGRQYITELKSYIF